MERARRARPLDQLSSSTHGSVNSPYENHSRLSARCCRFRLHPSSCGRARQPAGLHRDPWIQRPGRLSCGQRRICGRDTYDLGTQFGQWRAGLESVRESDACRHGRIRGWRLACAEYAHGGDCAGVDSDPARDYAPGRNTAHNRFCAASGMDLHEYRDAGDLHESIGRRSVAVTDLETRLSKFGGTAKTEETKASTWIGRHPGWTLAIGIVQFALIAYLALKAYA